MQNQSQGVWKKILLRVMIIAITVGVITIAGNRMKERVETEINTMFGQIFEIEHSINKFNNSSFE